MQKKNTLKSNLKRIIPKSWIIFAREHIIHKTPVHTFKAIFIWLTRPIENKINSVKLENLRRNNLSGDTPYIIFKDISDSFWFWILTNMTKANKDLNKTLPQMPEEKFQLQFTGISGYKTLEEAFSFYLLIKNILKRYGKKIDVNYKILDYGCGWGRIIRFFLKDLPASNLYGIDCDEEIIKVCNFSNINCNFIINNIYPPTKFENSTFDIIYSFSVFSHLSEDAHKQWLKEFQRILKPGGILIVTTRHRDFIIYCARMRKISDVPFYATGPAGSFLNTNKSLREYDNGKYVYDPVGGGGLRDGSFYGETCIPEKYVMVEWKKYFSKLEFINYKKHQKFDQNAIIAQR